MMWPSLSAFYTSVEWRGCRSSIIADRSSKNGGIVKDEHTGNPIYNAYDIVAHHKIPITMQNVNDVSISLNPENIMLVTHRSHNEIHARYGFSCMKKVYYVYGAPCSGKTTFVKNSKGNSDLVIDIDLIWQSLTGGELYEKPDALKANVFAVRDCLLDNAKTRTGKWERCWIIEGGAVKAQRERRIMALGAESIFIDTDKETCLRRLMEDERRANVIDEWKGYIENWFASYIE